MTEKLASLYCAFPCEENTFNQQINQQLAAIASLFRTTPEPIQLSIEFVSALLAFDATIARVASADDAFCGALEGLLNKILAGSGDVTADLDWLVERFAVVQAAAFFDSRLK